MQFACLSIDFDHTKFQPRSVSYSGKTSPPCGNHKRSVGDFKLCEANEAKTAQASSPAICAESVAWISLVRDITAVCCRQHRYKITYKLLSQAFSRNIKNSIISEFNLGQPHYEYSLIFARSVHTHLSFLILDTRLEEVHQHLYKQG